MLLSMTGFSSLTDSLPVKGREDISFAVELKSLNSRFFEVTCKLPSSLSSLEIPIVNLLKQKLVRGRVFVAVRLGGTGGTLETVVPVVKLVKDYLAAAQTLKKECKIPGELNISDIAMLPNVFTVDCETIDRHIEEAILKMVGNAAEKLIATRREEGDILEQDLAMRFDTCAKYIDKIEALFDQYMKEQKTEIKRVLALSQSGDQEAESQLSECYETVNKIDIHEEIVRFRSHLKSTKKLLKEKQIEKGRRFEFIGQELSREINTIAAKCSHFSISSVAVDVKVELEKIREQVQNIV